MNFVRIGTHGRGRRTATIVLFRSVRNVCSVLPALLFCSFEGGDLAVGIRFYAACPATTRSLGRFLRRTKLTLCSGRAEPLDVVIARSLHGKGRPTGRTYRQTAARPRTERPLDPPR